MIRVGVYCHLSFSDSVRFDQGSAITMMMSILLVLVQFPGCWAANCSSRPWVGKTATMKYNSELFSLRDIMSWWCLFKVLYPVTYFVLTLSYPPTKSCMWHRVKVQVNVVNIMRPQVRVGLGHTLDAFACPENQTPSKWYFLNVIVMVKESLSCQKWMYFRKHNKYLLWVGNWCFGFFWQKPQSCHAETSSWYFATFEQQLILPLSVRI